MEVEAVMRGKENRLRALHSRRRKRKERGGLHLALSNDREVGEMTLPASNESGMLSSRRRRVKQSDQCMSRKS
jgi:hypothetical protein